MERPLWKSFVKKNKPLNSDRMRWYGKWQFLKETTERKTECSNFLGTFPFVLNLNTQVFEINTEMSLFGILTNGNKTELNTN